MHSILIIEDEPDILSNMELILKMEGFAVHSASNGRSGIAAIHEKCPDLVLCDILMPDMNGLAVLKLLREGSDYPEMPFIFVTALGARADMRLGMSAGADDYLTKPFSAEELVSAVTGRLRRLETLRLFKDGAAYQVEQAILRERISAREKEVLLLVGKGVSSKEIAIRLGISLRTVEVHRSNLLRKLDAENTAILARWAVIAERMQDFTLFGSLNGRRIPPSQSPRNQHV